MKETLIIRNFGPIGEKGVELDLRKINIFIGDQGTGKSTVAKLYAAILDTNFNEIFNITTNKYTNEWDENNSLGPFKEFKKALVMYEIDGYISKGFYFKLYLNNQLFVEYIDNKIKVKSHSERVYFPTRCYTKLFIPANREATNVLGENFYDVIKAKSEIPNVLINFGSLLTDAKKAKNKYEYIDLLKVAYEYKDGIDFIILENGKKVYINTTSSAIQSSIPMLVSFDNANEEDVFFIEKNRIATHFDFVFIEEPELNLFPETQKKLLEYLVSKTTFELRKCLFITTHSPYTLTTLNNLMYAYQVGQKHKEEVSKIIKEKYWVNPKDVSCYLMKGGEAELIMDKDGLIKSHLIDSVSGILNKEYNEIINLEIGLANETNK